MPNGMLNALILALFLPTAGAAGHFIPGDYVVPQNTSTVTVDTKFGRVEGFKVIKQEYSANIFVGIPFAAKPIGELRLEKPEPVKPWKGTLEAKQWPLPCTPQCKKITKFFNYNAEDCLYLNIFTPSTPPPANELYPVAVWIHGGGFMFGDTQSYGYEGFAKNLVNKGIVVVSIQYRLGAFGWFSLGDPVAPGNLGLWDQRQALLFLHDVLKDFGGDKDRITVFGQSAGGASTGFLAVSPHSRDLFAQAYQISGSALLDWSNAASVVTSSKHLAELLNCPKTTHSKTLKNCVKSKTTEEILQASDKMGVNRNARNSLYYQAYKETDWIVDDYYKELAKAKPKPTIIGLTSKEAYLGTVRIKDSLAELFNKYHGVLRENQHLFTKQNLTDCIYQKIAPVADFGEYAEDAAKDLIEFYAESASEEDLQNPVYYFSQYSQLFTDFHYFVMGAKEALKKAKLGWPTYMYLFDWVNPKVADKLGFLDGAPHGMDLAYIMNAFLFEDFEFNEVDYKIKKIMVDGVVNFIKTGNPSSVEETWPQLPKTEAMDFPYKFLGTRQEKATNYFTPTLQFWKKFNDKYDFDITRGSYKQAEQIKDEF
uniref:Carboxylic ester hydrolase n=1 Tax=Panagrellus redivivus TaxID=6233 RepID=A0A7E4V9C5_PANRE